VSVTGPACAGRVRSALRTAGAHVVRKSSAWSVRVETFAQASSSLSSGVWQGRGLTVSLDGGRVMVYRGRPGLRPDPAAHRPQPAEPEGVPDAGGACIHLAYTLGV